MADKQYLAGKTGEELKELVAQYGMPRFTASQIAAWLYRNRVKNIDQMTNLSKINREKLSADFEIGYTEPIEANRSEDGTVKYLFAAGENFIEPVYIPDRERATLCVSSQVGCKMNCYFCMTGKQGFKKNLTATEIINQIVSIPEFEKLTNIVFMGMGEPLDNTDEVLKALDILTSESGFAWSPRRITLSTIGITPSLRRFLDESQCRRSPRTYANPKSISHIPNDRTVTTVRFQPPAPSLFRIHRFRRYQRYPCSHQRTGSSAAWPRLPYQSHTVPYHPASKSAQPVRRKNDRIPRCPFPQGYHLHHTCLPGRRHQSSMRYAVDRPKRTKPIERVCKKVNPQYTPENENLFYSRRITTLA